jgi:hypothetical protein
MSLVSSVGSPASGVALASVLAGRAVADTTVKKVDLARLRAAMKASADLIRSVEGDEVGLKPVFGSKAPVAKANYARARAAWRGCPAEWRPRCRPTTAAEDGSLVLRG